MGQYLFTGRKLSPFTPFRDYIPPGGSINGEPAPIGIDLTASGVGPVASSGPSPLMLAGGAAAIYLLFFRKRRGH